MPERGPYLSGMAKKNTGKPSEQLWREAHDRLGKQAVYFRLVDSAEIKAKTGKVAVAATSQPSDYILTLNGITAYCEVKSTHSKTSFPFNLIKSSQSAAAQRVLAAGGEYRIYVHRLETGEWFCIPYPVIQAVKDSGKSSIPWQDLTPLRWSPR